MGRRWRMLSHRLVGAIKKACRTDATTNTPGRRTYDAGETSSDVGLMLEQALWDGRHALRDYVLQSLPPGLQILLREPEGVFIWIKYRGQDISRRHKATEQAVSGKEPRPPHPLSIGTFDSPPHMAEVVAFRGAKIERMTSNWIKAQVPWVTTTEVPFLEDLEVIVAVPVRHILNDQTRAEFDRQGFELVTTRLGEDAPCPVCGLCSKCKPCHRCFMVAMKYTIPDDSEPYVCLPRCNLCHLCVQRSHCAYCERSEVCISNTEEIRERAVRQKREDRKKKAKKMAKEKEAQRLGEEETKKREIEENMRGAVVLGRGFRGQGVEGRGDSRKRKRLNT